MNMKKKLLGAAIGMAVMLGMAGLARAGGVLSALGSTDTIKLLVTPTVNYGVTITSVNSSGYDFGAIDINTSEVSTAPIIVTNTGNVSENWMMRVDTSAANWDIGGSTGPDVAKLQAVFLSSLTTTSPIDGVFGSSHTIITGNSLVGYGGAQGYNYNPFSVINTGGISANPTAVNGRARSLWLRFSAPSYSSTANQQMFRLYVVTAFPY
jgi:hypothetical protein